MANPADQLKELKAFNETKAGCKGLVDAGITQLPRIFQFPPSELHKYPVAGPQVCLQFPIIDFQAPRGEVVEKVGKALHDWGFFQALNHGIPMSIMDETLEGARRFHQQKAEMKKEFYTHDLSQNVSYVSNNFNMFNFPFASWRDDLNIKLSPNGATPEEIPATCREILVEYAKQVEKFGITFMELMSEALGLNKNYLKEMGITDNSIYLIQYFPSCPQPEKTLGVGHHQDKVFFNALLQDNCGGLQVFHHKQWVDVPTTPGALTINAGDLMQLVSNDKFKSSDHRVKVRHQGSIAVSIFYSADPDQPKQITYGPIKELLSEENPAKYREITIKEYYSAHFAEGLNENSALRHFRV